MSEHGCTERDGPPSIRNALSVAVEGFVGANLEGFPPGVSERHHDRAREHTEIASNVREVLALFAEFDVLGTFFFLGRIARDIPEVIREVAAAGHEIGCHSDEHRRIFGQMPNEFRSGHPRRRGSRTSAVAP